MYVYVVNNMVILQLITDEYSISLFQYHPHLVKGLHTCFPIAFSIGRGGVDGLFLQLKFILPQHVMQLYLIIFNGFSGAGGISVIIGCITSFVTFHSQPVYKLS